MQKKIIKRWFIFILLLLSMLGLLNLYYGTFNFIYEGSGVIYAFSEQIITDLPDSEVVIVKAEKNDVNDLIYDDIKSLIREAVYKNNDFKDLIKDGYTVVLKPNLVTLHDYTLPGNKGRKLAPEVNGTTTDWRVTKVVAELVRELNPTGEIIVMEGSAQSTTKAFKQFKYTKEYMPVVDEFIALEETGKWKDYNSEGLVKVELEKGQYHLQSTYYLNRKYKEADVVISLPVLKTHWSVMVSGGIKNVGIGATPANIYGRSTTNNQRGAAIDHSLGILDAWIHDFFMCRPVDYVIVEGLQGVQNGPTPSYNISHSTNLADEQKNMRIMVAGRDAVAVDTISGLIMGWDPEPLIFLKLLNQSKMGNLDTANIKVLGIPVDEIQEDFEAIPSDYGVRIKDKKGPVIEVKETFIKDNILTVSLDVDAEINKMEIYINDKLVEPVIKENFTKQVIELSDNVTEITLVAYDRFLNKTVKIINLTS